MKQLRGIAKEAPAPAVKREADQMVMAKVMNNQSRGG